MISIMKICFLIYSIVMISCSNHATNESSSGKTESVNSLATMQQAHAFSSDSLVMTKLELTKIYVQSITDYIKAVNKDYTIKFDTLFFGKHIYGQPDDFPDIELPEMIENTQIRLVTPEFGAQKQKDNKSSFFINLIGWVDNEKVEFIFITFSNNNEHQFDYYLNYNHDIKLKEITLDKIRFENFLHKKR